MWLMSCRRRWKTILCSQQLALPQQQTVCNGNSAQLILRLIVHVRALAAAALTLLNRIAVDFVGDHDIHA